MKRFHPAELAVMAAVSAGAFYGTARGWPLFGSLLETAAVLTGVICVWLVVREHVWNFPIGILSSGLFLVLFSQQRLFGDAGLQVFFIALGFQGWYWWLHGGVHRTELKITRMSARMAGAVVVFLVIATPTLMAVLKAVKGSAPFLDSLTTTLSLAGQYLLNNKKIENWLVWIVADSIYIYLYITRGLGLTAVLYGVFLLMCVAGLIHWRRSLGESEEPLTLEPLTHPGPAEVP